MTRSLAGRRVLLTGASGGIGTHIAKALHERGAKLALTSFPEKGLPAMAENLARPGETPPWLVADLRSANERNHLVEWARDKLGTIDILINNAAIEFSSPYHQLDPARIADSLGVNLEAPMMLTHALLPEMLRQGQGHIVNISSLAARSGPAFQEPYAATKAALDAFTSSLRATYRKSGVSASVICPGFVEAGIYARLCEQAGCAAPPLLAGCPPERVARAVIRAILKDCPEIIVSRFPVRPLLAISALSPRLGAWITTRLGVHEFFRKVVASSNQPPQ